MDKLEPHAASLLPHLDKLAPYLPFFIKHLDDIIPQMGNTIPHLDALIDKFGWTLPIGGHKLLQYKVVVNSMPKVGAFISKRRSSSTRTSKASRNQSSGEISAVPRFVEHELENSHHFSMFDEI